MKRSTATTSVCRSFGFACAVAVSSGLLGIPAANAAFVWDFGSLASGLLGTTHDFTVDGVTLTASGFSNDAQLNSGAPNINLFVKNTGGPTETGLGLEGPDDEITGMNLLHIAMAAGLSDVMFRMESTQGPDAFVIFGSNSPTQLGTQIFAGGDAGIHPLDFFPFYNIEATAGDVLLNEISAVPGPVVGAGLPGLIAALGGLVAMARRRRRKQLA